MASGYKVLAQATPRLSSAGWHQDSIADLQQSRNPFGSQTISQTEKQMQELWITEGLAGLNPGKRWCLWVRKGLRVPWGSCHAHRYKLGIHRNTLLTEGQLITSAADIGFNICVLIYLTSAEHPKKIFKYRMAIRLLSEFIKYLTLLFQMFSVLQNSKCILPNMFSVNVYLEGNLIRMLLMHLHLTHQNVLLESFDVQETFWVFFISLFKPILLRNRKSPVTNHKRMQSP